MAREVIDIIIQQRGAVQVSGSVREIGSAADATQGRVQLLRNALRGLAGAFSVREVLRAVDSYQRMQNQLRVVGYETNQLAAAQTQLFGIAQRTRTPLEETVNLYGKLAQSAGELGKSQAEMMRFTELTGQALAIQGTSTAGSRAALLQLSQAMGEGIVRAQEYNSLIENARPLLVAAAQGMDRAGGSVAKLRTLVLAGEVTSQDFFDAVLAGGTVLEEQFGSTIPTIGQGLTVLNNGWTQFVGESAAGQAILSTLGGSLVFIGNNFETIATLAVAAGTAFATYWAGTYIIAATASLYGYVAGQVALNLALGATSVSAALAGTAIKTLQLSLALLSSVLLPITAAVITLGGAYVLLSNRYDSAKTATDAAADANIALDEALTGVNTATASGLATARSLIVSRYNEAIAAREAAVAHAELVLERRRLAEETFDPFDGPGLGELRDTLAALDASRATLDALRGRAAEVGIEFTEAGNAVDVITGNLVRSQEEVNNLHAAQLRIAGEDRARAAEAQAEADAIISKYQDQTNLLQLALQYGNDSVQVSQERQQQETALISEQTRGLDIADSVRQEIVDAVAATYEAERATSAWAGKMSQVQARLSAIARQLSAFGASAIDTAANFAEAQALRAGATIEQASSERRLNQIKAENAAEIGGAKTFAEGVAARLAAGQKLAQFYSEQELTAARNLAAERDAEGATGGGGGSSKTVQETDFQKAYKALVEETASALQALTVQQQALDAAFANGVINQDQYIVKQQEIRVGLAEWATEGQNAAGALREANEEILQMKINAGDGSFADGFLLGLSRMTEGAQNFSATSGQIFSDYFGQLSDGIANSIGQALVYSEDLGEALSSVAKEALAGLISAFVKLGIQWLINAAIGKTLAAAATATTTAQASAAAAAWAPAAALASLATSGANAAPASAAIASTTALSAGVAASAGAFADGGEIKGQGGPREDNLVARVSNGEFIVNARDAQKNMGVLEAINQGRSLPMFRNGGEVTLKDTASRRGRSVQKAATRDADATARNRGNDGPQGQAQPTPDNQFVFLQDPALVGQYMQTDDGRAAIVKVLSEEGVL